VEGNWKNINIPIDGSISGHAVFLDAKRFLPHLKQSKFPGPSLKFKLPNNFNLLLTGGYVLNRIYESFDPNNNQLKDADLENSLFVAAGLTLT
jgi:hypothetical protein